MKKECEDAVKRSISYEAKYHGYHPDARGVTKTGGKPGARVTGQCKARARDRTLRQLNNVTTLIYKSVRGPQEGHHEARQGSVFLYLRDGCDLVLADVHPDPDHRTPARVDCIDVIKVAPKPTPPINVLHDDLPVPVRVKCKAACRRVGPIVQYVLDAHGIMG
jgi:hypothetical protein